MITALLAAAAFAPLSASGTIYDFALKDIDGKPKPLKDFKGKVLLVVNVASKCGMTPQYEGLEALYRKYKKDGLVVLGFPANDFREQEPGSDAEIKQFCRDTYGVTFPMFSKIAVTGEAAHPLYRWLVGNSDRKTEPIEWNFAKFVIGRDGRVAARFSPRTSPDAPELLRAVEAALGR